MIMKQSIQKWIGALLRWMDELLFPENVLCLCCDRALGEEAEDGICPACMDALRQLDDVPHTGKVLVVTLDPVSRRERSKPQERAPMVDFWVNAYCSPYRNVRDVAAWMGGPWGHCPQADENMAYSGKLRDADGKRFAHVHPEPLLMEPPPGGGKSPHEVLREACERFNIGKK